MQFLFIVDLHYVFSNTLEILVRLRKMHGRKMTHVLSVVQFRYRSDFAGRKELLFIGFFPLRCKSLVFDVYLQMRLRHRRSCKVLAVVFLYAVVGVWVWCGGKARVCRPFWRWGSGDADAVSANDKLAFGVLPSIPSRLGPCSL